MNRKSLKKKIVDAYEAQTPNLLSGILSSCEKVSQEPAAASSEKSEDNTYCGFSFTPPYKRMAIASACAAAFVFMISLGFVLWQSTGAQKAAVVENVIYIDVNPSIELKTNGENKVVEVIAKNAEAEAVIADMVLTDVELNTALKAIVGSMYINGYLKENSNSILISVDSRNEQTVDNLLRDITAKINDLLEKSSIDCAIIAQCVSLNDELISKAEAYSVSAGKMHFINKITEGYGEISNELMDVLSELSINDLSLLYQQSLGGGSGNCHEYILGEMKAEITHEEALDVALELMGKGRGDLSSSCVFLRPSISDDAKVAYAVYVELDGDTDVYRYEVDCSTGEIYIIIRIATLTDSGVVYREILCEPIFSIDN